MQRKKICNTHLENMRMKDTKVSLRSRDSSWLKWSPVWYQPWVDAFLMYFSVISATPHRKSFSNNKSFEFPKDHSIWLHLMTQLAATFLKRSSFSFMSDIVLCQIQFECKWHCYVYKCCIIYLTTNAFLFNLIDGSGGEQAF